MANVKYKGLPCQLISTWWDETPEVQLVDPKHIDSALDMGFQCVGHPNEIVKVVTEQEYHLLTTIGRID